MVRAFHPELFRALDDNRITAAHAELHYMMNALVRGRGQWWAHPETQRFYGAESYLRFLHQRIVEEYLSRGFEHNSPMTGPGGLRPGRIDGVVWLEQDMADLYRKYLAEGRIEADGRVHLGSATYSLVGPGVGTTKKGKSITGFRPFRGFHLMEQPGAIDLDYWAYVADKLPERSWGDPERATMRDTLAFRGPSTDPWAIRDWQNVHPLATMTVPASTA